MKNGIIIAILVSLTSCTAVKVAVPDTFSSQATRMPVKGLNGWMVRQQLSFGPYTSSAIRRGWDFSASVQYTKFRVRPEEAIARVFGLETDNNKNYRRHRFQYTLEDGKDITEVYATERFTEKQLVYRSNNPWIGGASKTHRYEYAFTATIVPLTGPALAPWSVVLVNRYELAKDTARRLGDRPYVEEEGYATNGKETITIRPLRIEKVTTKKGRDTKVVGGSLLSGYELKWGEGVVGIVDILDNSVWIYNDMEGSDKLLVSSVASSIMLKRMQDVEKEKDDQTADL